jgi:YegS/Rv2252/BmrU family lipid kinase
MEEGFFFIINPQSANGRTGRWFMNLLPTLKAHIGRVEYEMTKAHKHAIELAFDACKRGEKRIVSVGGDGTHNEVSFGILQSGEDAMMAIMPSGTGGDFRRVVGVGRGEREILSYLKDGVSRKIDAGVLSFCGRNGKQEERTFINIASCGISGLVDYYVNTTTKVLGGRVSFFLGTLRGMITYKNQAMKVVVDDDVLCEGKTCLTAIANGRFFGGGMMVAPNAILDDGLFDVVVFEDLSKFRFLSLATKIYSGKHIGVRGIIVTRGRRVCVEGSGGALIDLDGEQVGNIPIEAKILPKALNLLFPRA